MPTLDEELAKLRQEQKQAETAAVEAAWSRYREIVLRRDEPQAGDARALLGAMKVAGIADEEHAKHVDALDSIKRDEPYLFTDERRAELASAIDLARAEADRLGIIRGAAVDAHAEAVRRREALNTTYGRAVQDDTAAQARISGVRLRYPRLFE